MGVTAFNKPSSVLQYTPIPFQNIAFVGDKARAASNAAASQNLENSAFNVETLTQDQEANRQAMGAFNERMKALPDLQKESSFAALKEAKSIAAAQKAYQTTGPGYYYAQSRKAMMDEFKKIDDSKFGTAQDKLNRKNAIREGFKGTTQDQDGLWNSYQSGNFQTIDKSIADQALDFTRYVKADTTQSGMYKVDPNSPFYNSTMREGINADELRAMIKQHVGSETGNVNYLDQKFSDELLAQGVDPSTGVNVGGQQYSFDEAVGLMKDDYINQSIEGATQAGAYSTLKVSSVKDTLAEWNNRRRAETTANPGLTSDHINLPASGAKIETPASGFTYDDKGNLSNTREQREPGVVYSKKEGMSPKIIPDVQKNKEQRAVLDNYLTNRGYPTAMLYGKTDKQKADFMKEIAKNQNAKSFVMTGVSNQYAKDLGKKLNNVGEIGTYTLLKDGQVLNKNGTLQGASDWIDDQSWLEDNDIKDIRATLQEKLDKGEVSGILVGVPGIPSGSPVVTVPAAGGSVQIVMSPPKELQEGLSVANDVSSIINGATGSGIAKDSQGRYLAVTSRVNPETNETTSEIKYVEPKNNVNIENNTNFGELTPAEISNYFEPIEGMRTYSEGDIYKIAEETLVSSGKLGTNLTVTKPNQAN